MVRKVQSKRFSGNYSITELTHDEIMKASSLKSRRSIQEIVDTSKDFLKINNLPTAPILYELKCPETEAKYWTDKKNAAAECLRELALPAYIIHEKGYVIGGLEETTASLIFFGEQLLRAFNESEPNLDRVIFYSIRFGRILTLDEVYTIESRQNRVNAQKSKKKEWAREVISKHSHKGEPFKEFWRYLPSQMSSDFVVNNGTKDKGYVYIEQDKGKEYLIFESIKDESTDRLTRETLRTEYFTKRNK